MKRKLILLGLLLCCHMVATYAQAKPNDDFQERATDLKEKINQAFREKDYKASELYSQEIIALFERQPKEYQKENTFLKAGYYYNLACFQSLQKKIAAGIKSLEYAIRNGYNNYRYVLKDTDLDNLRNDRRFQSVLEKLRETGDYLYILKNAPGYTRNERTDTLPKFTYAHPNDSNLVRVRRYFKLDSVAGSGDELSKIKNILTYIHNMIKHDGNHPNPKSANAIGMAEACKDGSRGLNCRGLATVLNECYLAMGFKSRFITCMPKTYISDCHVINAVYSCTLDKWLYIDPTQNAWVMDENGTMLSIQEVRERLRDNRPLILNEEANWNNQRKTTKEEYLDNYMAKNLYYVECTFRSRFDTEAGKFNPKNYVAIVPTGYTNHRIEKYCIVNDDTWFWQSPYHD